MAFTPKLTYRGRPLVRSNNEIYYGNMADPFVVFMQVLTEKEQGGVKIADKVQVMLLSTDTAKALPERVVKQGTKVGLYTALDIGSIWLMRTVMENWCTSSTKMMSRYTRLMGLSNSSRRETQEATSGKMLSSSRKAAKNSQKMQSSIWTLACRMRLRMKAAVEMLPSTRSTRR